MLFELQNIKNIDIDHQLLGFFCEKCKLIYPVKEKICILLSKSARNYTLEYDLVESIKKKSFSYPTEQLKQYINNLTYPPSHYRFNVKCW